MDEVEFARVIGNLRVLTSHIEDVDIANAFKAVTAALAGLNQRIIEMQTEEDDD